MPLLENEVLLFNVGITPNSTHVVYSIQNTDDRSLKIYSTPIGGGTSQQLSANAPAGTTIAFNPKFDVSPDGQRIIYRLQSTSTFALISAPISGGAIVTLTPSLGEGGAITNYRFSMNGSHVLYVADQETNERFALYAVPTSGGSAVNLSGIQDTGAPIDELYRTNGNDRVIYTRYINNKTDLFSVSISNGAPIQLTAATESAGLVTWTSPDNRKVVFFTQYDENGVSKYKLYAISPEGGTATVLSSTDQTGGNAQSVSDVDFTSDSKHVIFSINQNSAMSFYSVPIKGGSLLKLGGPANGDNFSPSYYTLKKYADDAVYFDDKMDTTTFYQVSATTAQSVTIGSTTLPIFETTLTPDDGYLIFYTRTGDESFIIPLAGGTPTRFTVELQAGEYIDPFDDFTPVLVNNQICQVYALTLRGNGHRKAIYSSCVPALEIDWPYDVYLPTVAR